MKRAVQIIAGMLLLAVGWSQPAHALSQEEIFKRCIDNLKKEFGEASVEFNKFRRNGNREMAFGELEMKDGTTRTIRCRVRHGRRVDVNFRTNGSGNDAWSAERPSNAGFIEPEKTEPEKKDPEEKETEANQEAQAQPSRWKAIPGASTPRTQTAEPKPEPTGTAETTEDTAPNAENTDTENAENTETPSEDEQTAETTEPAEAEVERKPRFIKVPKQ